MPVRKTLIIGWKVSGLAAYEKHLLPSQLVPLRSAGCGSIRSFEQCLAAAQGPSPSHQASPIHLGLASYTFRDFSRAQMIASMKQLNVFALNAKDVKDHLPIDAPGEAAALADYAASGIRLHAAGAIYFERDEDADIRSKFEY